MKTMFFSLTLLLFLSCASTQKDDSNAVARANLAARNKETAARNEMIRLIEEAQKLEQAGRELEVYRQAKISIESGVCAKALERKIAGMENFQKRMEEMPESYRSQLEIIFTDLNKCLACTAKALESCKKSRMNINQTIKEVFPQ